MKLADKSQRMLPPATTRRTAVAAARSAVDSAGFAGFVDADRVDAEPQRRGGCSAGQPAGPPPTKGEDEPTEPGGDGDGGDTGGGRRGVHLRRQPWASR